MSFHLGVCYYPEHWPAERWPVDARMMREAGLTYVRIGEFAWAQIEPEEGRLDWAWLDGAIETLAGAGLQIVLGTPTAAPPAWLVRKYPEVLPVDREGRVREFGSRRHVCPSSRVYHNMTRHIVRSMAERYGKHSNLYAWQIDNEFGCHDTARCYCERCCEEFHRWLESRYHTLEALNDAWGTVFWSQKYTDWRQIRPPYLAVTEQNASHALDYYRFSSDAWVAYETLQVELLSELSPGKPVSHNYMGNFQDLDYHKLAEPLDWVTWDSYPTGYAEVNAPQLYSPEDVRPALAHDVGDPYVTGFCHDLTRGIKGTSAHGRPFWVMEQQCGNINWASYNTGLRPGAVRLWTWHALASGADAVVYFRWRACLYAQEQMHSGLLRHDASPAQGYLEVAGMAGERALMDEVAAHPHTAEVAIFNDYEDLWALQLQPHRQDFTYQRSQFRRYRALQRWGVATDLVSPGANLSRYKLVFATPAILVSDERGRALASYVEGGGFLVMGVRSGFKTESNVVTDRPLPGALRELAGVTVKDWHALPPGIEYGIRLDADMHQATVWAERLEPGAGTAVRARYTGGPWSGDAAMTLRSFGAGQVAYVGWHPSPGTALSVIGGLLRVAGIERLEQPLPEGMVFARRGPYRLLFNFAEGSQRAEIEGQTVPVPGREVKVW
jgi:beta-galactosidase